MANKKTFVMARTPQAMEQGIQTSKGTLSFRGKSGMHINDPGLASEIEQTVGLKGSGDVWTHEDPVYSHQSTYKADGVHGYIFGPTSSYAKAWEEFEARRKARQERGE